MLISRVKLEEHSRWKRYCSFLESFDFVWLFLMLKLDRCAGYGGALSVYFGLSAGLRLLSVSFFRIALQNNAFTSCVVSVDAVGGNAYGGAVSLYIGGYSSVFSSNGNAAAAVGDTVVRNVSVAMDTTRFESCSAMRTNGVDVSGANVYGGSFSFYIGGYTRSESVAGGNSSSTCGATNVSGVFVRIQTTSSLNSRASTTAVGGFSDGANVYGGSMSVLYIGAYAWSFGDAASSSSSSKCEATSASSVSVQVSDSVCWNCSALSTSGGGGSFGANSYGGSMSVLYVGAYSWSFGLAASSNSSSRCEATSASGVSVQVSDSACWNCSALSTSGGGSFGANSYGGSISACYIGAFSYSFALGDGLVSSRSIVGATRVHNLLITIRNATMAYTEAVIGEYCSIQLILFSQTDVILCISIKRGFIGRQREFFCPESSLLQSVVTTVFTLCRFTVAQSVRWWDLMRGH